MSDQKPGPTGNFPRGQLNEYDEGEINMSVCHTSDGVVFLDFGTSVRWIALEPDQAKELAQLLTQASERAEIEVC